jgi:hypothetical protein
MLPITARAVADGLVLRPLGVALGVVAGVAVGAGVETAALLLEPSAVVPVAGSMTGILVAADGGGRAVAVPGSDEAAVPIAATSTAQPPTATVAAQVEMRRPGRMGPV